MVGTRPMVRPRARAAIILAWTSLGRVTTSSGLRFWRLSATGSAGAGGRVVFLDAGFFWVFLGGGLGLFFVAMVRDVMSDEDLRGRASGRRPCDD